AKDRGKYTTLSIRLAWIFPDKLPQSCQVQRETVTPAHLVGVKCPYHCGHRQLLFPSSCGLDHDMISPILFVQFLQLLGFFFVAPLPLSNLSFQGGCSLSS